MTTMPVYYFPMPSHNLPRFVIRVDEFGEMFGECNVVKYAGHAVVNIHPTGRVYIDHKDTAMHVPTYVRRMFKKLGGGAYN